MDENLVRLVDDFQRRIETLETQDQPAVTGIGISFILNGSGVPSSGLGSNDDYYINNDNGDLYYKSGGAWAVITNLQGPTGAQGIQGATGATGPAGVNGDRFVVNNGSGAAAAFGDVGYIDEAGDYQTTTTANLYANWAVVITGGANGADIEVANRGRVSVNYTGSAPAAGDRLTTSTTAGSAQVGDGRPELFAIATAAGSGGVVQALLHTQTRIENFTTTELVFRINGASDSDWRTTINGAPSGTSVVYTTPLTSGTEDAIDVLASNQLSKIRLYNETQADYALISSVNTGTNTITLTATVPGTWANTDVITARSQTNTLTIGSSYFYDMEFTSALIPDLTRFIQIAISFDDSGGAGEQLNVHPWETGGLQKRDRVFTQSTQAISYATYMDLISNRYTLSWSASGAATADPILTVRQFGIATP